MPQMRHFMLRSRYMETTISTITELETLARDFVAGLSPHVDRATFVGLSGELGSGKTAFVKAVAKAFGVNEEITSPTFVIEKRYLIPHGMPFRTLVHIDAYRLNGGAELRPLRFGETLVDPKNLVLLEWPEQVNDALPVDRQTLHFVHVDDTTRKIHS